MTRSRFVVTHLLTSCTVALFGVGCDLEPKGVGGDPSTDSATGGATGGVGESGPAQTGESTADDADGSASAGGEPSSDTTEPTDGPPSEESDDIIHEWDDRFGFQVTTVPSGDVVVFGVYRGPLSTMFAFFDSEGQSEWGTAEYGVSSNDFTAMTVDDLAFGGGVRPIEQPRASDAYLWITDSGPVTHASVLAGGSSLTGAVEHGGGALWTLALERSLDAEGPRDGVLRRHALTGEIEASHEMLETAGGLAVDPEGTAYTMTASPRTLHRIETDGALAWSVPLETLGAQKSRLLAWDEPGAVLVEQVGDEQRIQVFDGTGAVLEDSLIPAPAVEERGPAAHATDTLMLAHPLPGGLLVEERELDGALVWSVERVVPGASVVWINDVSHHPDGAVVVGQAVVEGSEFGFVRFVHAP